MELLQFILPTRISFLNTTKKNPILCSQLIHSKPKPIRTTCLIAADAAPKEPTSESDSVPAAAADWKSKGSAQLSRWSRARSIRSGRRLVRQLTSPSKLDTDSAQLAASQESLVMYRSDDEEEGEVRAGKAIYMVSDGTGWTAEHSVNAALGQFEHCLVDRACAVNTHLFSAVEGEERLIEIIKQAAVEGALVLYTLADPNMAEAAKQACRLWGVPYTDILGPTTEAIATHLGVNPMGVPRGKAPLTREYFRRIEAIEFTIKQDDGAQPQNLHKADIVLVGVSRTGKTPLSIYLAQKGYRVANVPIVMGVEVPKTLFQIDQDKVFALTINPIVLQTIRKARAKTLGFGSGNKTNYWDMDHIKQELEYCGQIFGQNPGWPVIEVTGKAIEETAAVVVRIYHDRKQKCWIPRISKRY